MMNEDARSKKKFVNSSLDYYPTLFEKLGLISPIDFCFHLPFRYENQYHARTLHQALQSSGKSVLYLKVVGVQTSPKRTRWLVQDAYHEVQDPYLPSFDAFTPQSHSAHSAAGLLPDAQQLAQLPIYVDFFVGGRTLNIDQNYFFYGELKYMGNHLQMSHPFILSYRRDAFCVPIYASTAGLNQHIIKQMVDQHIFRDLYAFYQRNPLMSKGLLANIVLQGLYKRLGIHSKLNYKDLADLSAEELLQKLPTAQTQAIQPYVLKRLLKHCGDDVVDALDFLHHLPVNLSPLEYQLIAEKNHPCQDLLKLYEYLAYQISLLKAHQLKKQHQITPLLEKQALKKIDDFTQTLPWELTEGQKHAWAEILADLQKPAPMQRLLQGDVGSGKTVIAFLASLYVASHQQQVVIMAPTEILAQQLAKKCQQFLAAFDFKIELLVGSTKAKAKQQIKKDLQTGTINIIIGTHALIEDDVLFKNLGLIVIDEQHRFGVRQRLKLKQKYVAHELMMSATPIPRTLAMGLYAYLNLSTIHGLPANRLGIQTKVLSIQQRPALIQRLKHLLTEKAQIYWVCPLIAEKEKEEKSENFENSENSENKNQKISDKKTLQNAKATYELLCQELPNARIALLHGKIKAAEKNEIMNQFAAGEIDLLVATTVIEVGVDVPNANVMIIEDATQFGLAQLHQLRGRVGRGARESFCLLLYQNPIGAMAKERLKVMQDTQDGFIIAQKDLELRGFGELLGQKQAGEISFRLFDFIRDGVFVPFMKILAEEIINRDYDVTDFIEFWLSKDFEIIQEQP